MFSTTLDACTDGEEPDGTTRAATDAERSDGEEPDRTTRVATVFTGRLAKMAPVLLLVSVAARLAWTYLVPNGANFVDLHVYLGDHPKLHAQQWQSLIPIG